MKKKIQKIMIVLGAVFCVMFLTMCRKAPKTWEESQPSDSVPTLQSSQTTTSPSSAASDKTSTADLAGGSQTKSTVTTLKDNGSETRDTPVSTSTTGAAPSSSKENVTTTTTTAKTTQTTNPGLDDNHWGPVVKP